MTLGNVVLLLIFNEVRRYNNNVKKKLEKEKVQRAC
jgi:hypothetical protein